MKKIHTRMAALVLAFAVLCSLALCAVPTAAAEGGTPKYVFLFIGDGMTYSQFQLAASYQGANADTDDGILDGDVALNFMSFDTLGNATTYDSSSFCPDSASTATSIASGFKTYSGVINMDETKTVPFTTIAEQLRDNTDMKIGVVSSVNLNHATPAAFYAHTGLPAAVFAQGTGAELFAGSYDNTDIHDKLCTLLGMENLAG